jgi:hypothetical protein
VASRLVEIGDALVRRISDPFVLRAMELPHILEALRRPEHLEGLGAAPLGLTVVDDGNAGFNAATREEWATSFRRD